MLRHCPKILMAGQVQSWNATRGFGFLTGTDGHKYFVHFRQLNCEKGGSPGLHVGQQVEFDVEEGPKGPLAVRVGPVGGGLLPPGPARDAPRGSEGRRQ